MHRLIMKDPHNKQVDHINHDGLDNRKCNLRLCNSSQNNSNRRPLKKGTSKYKGVSWNKKDKAWCVAIRKNAKHIWGGNFKDEILAAKKYDELALEHHGEFAYFNFPHFLVAEGIIK